MDDRESAITNVIQEAWRLAGIEGEVPGLSASDLLEISKGNLGQSMPKALRNWLIVFDECIAWFCNLAAFLIFSLKLDPSGDARLRRVMACVLGNICAQALAIRKLVISGLDVQAKQLLRVLIENLDVALLIGKNEEALDAFEFTTDDNSANYFWHKYVSKGKARDKVHATLRVAIRGDASRELEEYLRQEEKILGMAIHPSLGAAQMACLPRIVNGDHSEPFTLGFLGGVSSFSERTLSYAVFYMIFYIIGGYVPDNISINECRDDIREEIDELQRRVMFGRIALLHIWQYVFQNKRNEDFSTLFPDHFGDDFL